MSNKTRIHKNAYRNGNASSMLDYLEELILIQNGENGRFSISEPENSFEVIEISNNEFKKLNVPENSIAATISIESDVNSSNFYRVIRFKENGAEPSLMSGIALGDNDIYEITGKHNLEQFKIIGIEPEKTHRIQIQYYHSPTFT